MTANSLDLEYLRQWIGRSESAEDTATPRLANMLRATLDEAPDLKAGDAAPLGLHWCLAPALAPMHELAQDGLPVRGDFLPPVPLEARMWAGGRLDFSDVLRVGDTVTRQSTISAVEAKEGRSGRLCFVSVTNHFLTERGQALSERQDIVYREPPKGDAAAPAGPDMPKPKWTREVMAEPVLLFRYSAMTFNAHRIHYDRDYCVDQEGYPGLLVHGPLQALLLLNFAASLGEGRAISSFDYRALSPLFAGAAFSLNAVEAGDGLQLWTADAGGRPCMQAEVTF